MKMCRWTLFVMYFLITNISNTQSLFSAYRRYRLYRLKIRHETLFVKNSTVNSSVLLPPHTLSSYFPSFEPQHPFEILFTIL